jgi:hypothetical protein
MYYNSLQIVVIHTYFKILYNLLIYVLYANEIFCYVSLRDKTRSRLQNDDLNLQIRHYIQGVLRGMCQTSGGCYLC